MLIREAIEKDLPEVLEILSEMDQEAGLEQTSARKIWDKFKEYPYYKVFVAVDEEKIIGTCSLIILDNLGHHGARLAVAENMIIRSEYRGKGIGHLLMHHVMEQAAKENCYKLMLSSNKKRTQAHRFYEQLGFQQHGISFMIEVEKRD